MRLLQCVQGVPEHATILVLLGVLWHAEASIEHVLIVGDDGGIASELVIEFVLGVGEEVTLLIEGGCVGLAAVWLHTLLVLSQVRIEGA